MIIIQNDNEFIYSNNNVKDHVNHISNRYQLRVRTRLRGCSLSHSLQPKLKYTCT